ncbi:MAG: histidinol-phosphate transaminase [Bacteroidales bacterium]|nr:histidinol-phosphate transaminase [Bacteroidales bacterium]
MNIEKLIRPNVQKLKPYSSARDDFKEKAEVYLDANENPFGDGLNRYPDPNQTRLKDVLSKQKGISPDRMLLGNGSDEVLDLIFRAFCEPGKDNVIIALPTYGMYEVLANINNLEVRKAYLNDDFTLNTERIISLIDENTKVVFLASPNNPTGNSFEEDTILELLDKLSCLLVIDEAYVDFSSKQSWINYLERYPQLIVTHTLSKAWGMAGIRLGMCFASSDIISVLNKIKPPYNVSKLTQDFAINALEDRGGFNKNLEVILKEKENLKLAFEQLPFVIKVYPSDANFWLIKVTNAGDRYKSLLNKGLVVRDRSKEPLCEDCLRISVGTPEENDRLLAVLNLMKK